MLLPRPDSALFDLVASRLTDIYNECEFDMVYFDGSEGMAALGSDQIPVAMFEELFYQKVRKSV